MRYGPHGGTIADLAPAGVVIGSRPRQPRIAEHASLADLQAAAGEPLAGMMPENAGTLDRPEFLAAAFAGLGTRLGGQGEARSRSES